MQVILYHLEKFFHLGSTLNLQMEKETGRLTRTPLSPPASPAAPGPAPPLAHPPGPPPGPAYRFPSQSESEELEDELVPLI